ncbi:MAG: XRE family transcriptional regulator [Alphaproteobacteria bacterium]
MENLPEIGQRLTEIRQSRGDSQEGFAARLQVSPRTYQRYEAGDALPKAQCFQSLADLGVNLDWLLAGRGAPDAPPLSADAGPGFVMVPRYEIAAAAGFGAFSEVSDPVDFLAFRADWLRATARIRPDQAALISAIGDSMDPTIRSGDLLLVDLGVTRLIDDAIYVVSLADRLMVKRIQRFHDGSVAICSDNPAYASDRLSPADTESLTIAGRVRWIGRMI